MTQDCAFEEDFIPYLAGHNVFSSPDTKMAQQIRWNEFVLYLLKIRHTEVTKLEAGLRDQQDMNLLNDQIYISMLNDIHKDQLGFISKCVSVFRVRLNDLNSKMTNF